MKLFRILAQAGVVLLLAGSAQAASITIEPDGLR